MKLSKTSAYAALAMAYLAACSADDLPVRARTIAEHLNVPSDSALKILQALARQQLVQSHLGRSGGYRLARPPRRITLLDIVQAVDGPVVGHVPIKKPRTRTPVADNCLQFLHDVCEQAAGSIRHQLAGVTVADLVHADDGTCAAT